MIDLYGRCSAQTLVEIGKEMADIETILAQQGSLFQSLMGSALSGVYLLVLLAWYGHDFLR